MVNRRPKDELINFWFCSGSGLSWIRIQISFKHWCNSKTDGQSFMKFRYMSRIWPKKKLLDFLGAIQNPSRSWSTSGGWFLFVCVCSWNNEWHVDDHPLPHYAVSGFSWVTSDFLLHHLEFTSKIWDSCLSSVPGPGFWCISNLCFVSFRNDEWYTWLLWLNDTMPHLLCYH